MDDGQKTFLICGVVFAIAVILISISCTYIVQQKVITCVKQGYTQTALLGQTGTFWVKAE